MNFYREQTQWRNVQPFLPKEFRLTASEAPREVFWPWQGMRIHLDVYTPPTQPLAQVILLHGVGGNGRLLSFLALPLCRLGFKVICPDLPLYGNTECAGPIAWSDWVNCTIDLARAAMHSTAPLFLFGLSAGGMLAYQAACKLPGLRGLLLSCLLDQRMPVVVKSTAAHPALAQLCDGPLLAAAKLGGQLRLPMKWVANMRAIVNQPELARLLMKDPRASGAQISLRFLASMLHPVIETEPEHFQICPVLLVHPGADRWTDLKLTRLFFDRLQAQKQLVILEGAGHFPIEEAGLHKMIEASRNFLHQNL